MEGAFRPGHFNGVGIVVSKLFHIVQPNKAFLVKRIYNNVQLFRAWSMN
jgi:pantoate--beta-alanine ligase